GSNRHVYVPLRTRGFTVREARIIPIASLRFFRRSCGSSSIARALIYQVRGPGSNPGFRFFLCAFLDVLRDASDNRSTSIPCDFMTLTRPAILQIFLTMLFAVAAHAQVQEFMATDEYRMGDNETRANAKLLALADAKRLIVEQAGTYLSSVTEVQLSSLAKDDIRT